ncbi:MAG: pyridoxal phosphate-dependent aminotransferase [Leptospirales bacterium]
MPRPLSDMLASRLSLLKPSPTLLLSSRARELKSRGIDVLDFSGGEPDFDTPEMVKQAAVKALSEGFTKYTAVGGIPDLKEAIREKFLRDQGLNFTPREIVVSNGAKHSLFELFQVLVNPGDQVLLPAPAWVSYPDQILLNQGDPVLVPCREEDGFRLDPDALASLLTPRSKLLVLNSPNNPTGAILDKKRLERIAEIVLKNDLLVISDEIYEKINYTSSPVPSLASLDPALRERTVIVNGVSKTYAMTGWRIGYAAGPREIMEAVDTVQSQTASNPNSIAQKAAAFAIRSGETFFAPMLEEYHRRRDWVVTAFNGIPGIRCAPPEGAFYVFPNVSGLLGRSYKGVPVQTVYELAEFFLDVARVAMVPGTPFGSPLHMRLSYAASLSSLQEGLRRLSEAVALLE